MSIIQLHETNCKNCHKCIRNCMVKSIRFLDEQARIIDDDCVLCGHCLTVCPQNAKFIKSDLDEVKNYIRGGNKVFVSLAPSYAAAFRGSNFAKLSAALKKLGFSRVEETAIGAAQVSAQYARLMQEGRMKNILSTCCPTVVLLVEKYYPELIDYLAPVLSPAVTHAKMMRNMYGPKIKVVFIGPCISKKFEAENSGQINAVLMFEELRQWMQEEGIELGEEDQEPAEMHGTINRLYPVPGGVLRTIPGSGPKNYKRMTVDGLDRVISILDSLKSEDTGGYFIEMNACAGSCVEGPGMKAFSPSFLTSKDLITAQARRRTVTPAPVSENTPGDFSAIFQNRSRKKKMPTEKEISAILAEIGKTREEDMLNCSACGYASCRDKAIAVYQGKAELHMCIPYMREKAESMSNLVMDHTPHAIFIVDRNYNIVEYNRSAARMFNMSDLNYKGLPVQMLIGERGVEAAIAAGGTITDFRANTGALTTEQSFIPIEKNINTLVNNLVLIKDVTREEEQHKRLSEIRNETVQTAQRVIDKQMRVVQEIASLLGETTGETKTVLNKLKKSIMESEGS